MTKGTVSEWAELQQAYRTANARREEFASERRLKYGDGSQSYYSAGERKAYEKLRAAENRASERIMKWLDRHSPRNWHTTVPAHWICSELTFEDAVTDGILRTVPPAAYGYRQAHVECFAAGTKSADYLAYAQSH